MINNDIKTTSILVQTRACVCMHRVRELERDLQVIVCKCKSVRHSEYRLNN